MGQRDKDSTKNAIEDHKTDQDARVQVSTARIGAIATITVAAIGLLGTLAGLIFNYLQWRSSLITPASPTYYPIMTETFTPVSEASSSPTVMSFISPTEETVTQEPITANTATSTPSLSTMFVKASANRTTGRAPLAVKFRAIDSYVVAPDGTNYYCSNGACHYTWFVYLSGTQVAKSDTTKNGTFEYKFDKTGTYLVNVNVCHGAENPTCNIGSILVFIE